MPEAMKPLGQLSPAATTLSTLYTVPAATQATVSSLACCNQNVGDVTVRVSVAVAGAADNVKQYLYYDLPVVSKDTFMATIGITLSTGDIVRVYASATGVSFNLFGIEYT